MKRLDLICPSLEEEVHVKAVLWLYSDFLICDLVRWNISQIAPSLKSQTGATATANYDNLDTELTD